MWSMVGEISSSTLRLSPTAIKIAFLELKVEEEEDIAEILTGKPF